MNGSRYYGVRVEGAKFGVGFGSASSHHDFIFAEPLDPVGDHRWNFELALCGLFRAFSRMTPPKRKPSLVGEGSPARPTQSVILLRQPADSGQRVKAPSIWASIALRIP